RRAAEPLLHLSDQLVDLIAQPALRQRDEHGVLAELRLIELLPVALEVERCRDDLPLLLGERKRLIAATTSAAAGHAAGHALRPPELLAERANLDEVDVARRRL